MRKEARSEGRFINPNRVSIRLSLDYVYAGFTYRKDRDKNRGENGDGEMTEYEYAVQWHYEGRQEWYTLVPRYKDVESARRDCERFVSNYADTEARVVRRLKSEWEVVE